MASPLIGIAWLRLFRLDSLFRSCPSGIPLLTGLRIPLQFVICLDHRGAHFGQERHSCASRKSSRTQFVVLGLGILLLEANSSLLGACIRGTAPPNLHL